MSIEDITSILYTLVLGFLIYRFLKNKKIINNIGKNDKNRGDK